MGGKTPRRTANLIWKTCISTVINKLLFDHDESPKCIWCLFYHYSALLCQGWYLTPPPQNPNEISDLFSFLGLLRYTTIFQTSCPSWNVGYLFWLYNQSIGLLNILLCWDIWTYRINYYFLFTSYWYKSTPAPSAQIHRYSPTQKYEWLYLGIFIERTRQGSQKGSQGRLMLPCIQ